MADFEPAFQKTMKNESWALTKTPGDRGLQTFAGISRRFWPNWPGWAQFIDHGITADPALTQLVREFYRAEFWNKIKGDEINSQAIAEQVYDFAVNAGPVVAMKLAQLIVGATPDGAVGPKTIAELDDLKNVIVTAEGYFALRYFVAKVARYAAIANRDKTQRAFILGWVNRALKVVA